MQPIDQTSALVPYPSADLVEPNKSSGGLYQRVMTLFV